MASRIEAPAVTVAAGTAIATPATTALTWRDGTVERVEVLVPPGPSGLVGFRILHSGQQVIPFQGTDWIITDNEKLSWDIDGYPTGGKWAIRAYNTDIYPHTLYFRFLIREFGLAVPAPVTLVPIVPIVEQVAIE